MTIKPPISALAPTLGSKIMAWDYLENAHFRVMDILPIIFRSWTFLSLASVHKLSIVPGKLALPSKHLNTFRNQNM